MFRLSEEEYARLEAAWPKTHARSLSDFARLRVLDSMTARADLVQVEEKLEEIRSAVQQLARAIGKA